MADKDIQMVIDHELALLFFQVRRSVRQIDELLNPDFARSEPRDNYGLTRKGSYPPKTIRRIMPLLGMLRHTHGSQAQSTHRDRGSTPHIHRTEHTTPPGPGEYPNTPDTPDTPPGNTGPHASVPESTPHTGPPADTDHAPHPAAPADHTQDSSTGARSSEH
jgi:hypothetical protein